MWKALPTAPKFEHAFLTYLIHGKWSSNGMHIFQKCLSHQSRIIFQRSLESSRIFGKGDKPSSSFSSTVICTCSSPLMPYLPNVFLIEESRALTLTKTSKACSCQDVRLLSVLTFWIHQRTLGSPAF